MRRHVHVRGQAAEDGRRARRRRVWWRAGVSLGALAVLAGGCSGTEPAEPASPAEATDADSQNEAEPSADETASGPPDVDPPEVPDIHRDDDEGAQNAAEYFLELYTYAFTSGSTAELEGVSSPNCQFCNNVRDRVTEMSDSGEYYEGGQLIVEVEETYPPIENDPRLLIRFNADQEPIVHWGEGGVELLRSDSDSEVRIDVALVYDEASSRWLVDGVEINAAD